MRILLKISILLLTFSCDQLLNELSNNEKNPFVGTWHYNSFEFKQNIVTNSDQTTTPIMGAMMGLVPYNNGIIIQGDGNNDTLNYMSMFMGILNMDFTKLQTLMESESNANELPEELCMLNLMTSNDFNNDNKIDYIVMCGGSYYMGNLPEDAMSSENIETLDFAMPLISIDQPVTFYNLQIDSLYSNSFVLNTTNNPKTITLNGSISYPQITAFADTPTDIMELQLGISLEEFSILEGDDDLMSEMGGLQTIIINADNTITIYEVLDDGNDMEEAVLDTCFSTWTLNGDELNISESLDCTSDDADSHDETDDENCACWSSIGDEGEDLCESGDYLNESSCIAAGLCEWDCEDDYDQEDDYGYDEGFESKFDNQAPTISINSDGHLMLGISTNSFCELLMTSEFTMLAEENNQLELEEDCKSALEEMLLFENGSIKSVELSLYTIYTNEVLTERLIQNTNDLDKQQELIKSWLKNLYPRKISYIK